MKPEGEEPGAVMFAVLKRVLEAVDETKKADRAAGIVKPDSDYAVTLVSPELAQDEVVKTKKDG